MSTINTKEKTSLKVAKTKKEIILSFQIDLLAAARCNMFSHVLVSYMSDMRQFAQKTTGAFEAISKALEHKPRYDFCVLKELTQHDSSHDDAVSTNSPSFDKDQTLFFALDFEDADTASKAEDPTTSNDPSNDLSLMEFYKSDVMDLIIGENVSEASNTITNDNGDVVADANNYWPNMFDSKISTDLNKHLTVTKGDRAAVEQLTSALSCSKLDKSRSNKNSKQSSWIELFAELDPLGNLEAFDMQLSSGRKNFQQT